MFLRILLIVCAAACLRAQNPAFRWIKQVDGSASDAVVGTGVDATGNIYIAGNTTSLDFPLKSAAQSQRKSSGLYRIDGPGSAWTPLPLVSASSIAVDPRNPNILYAASSNAGLKSTDGGQTWSTLSIPSPFVRTIAIDPFNSSTLYAGTSGQGAFKSTDGGATWTAINTGFQPSSNSAQIFVSQFWIDSNRANVVFAQASGGSGVFRSADGGATWQTVAKVGSLPNFWFDKTPGVIYANDSSNSYKSTDDGQTWNVLSPLPGTINLLGPVLSVTSDPNQPGRLIAAVSSGVFESTDDGATWTQRVSASVNFGGLTPDWANRALYFSSGSPERIVKISSDLQTMSNVGPPAVTLAGSMVVANGHVYVPATASNAVFVTKLDSNGNIVFSTYFGGSGSDTAVAMTVDPSGNVYVTGTTTSKDFPTTAGTYSPAIPAAQGGLTTTSSFVFKLKPDGSVGYATYFSDVRSTPGGIAVDAAGEAIIAGTSQGGLPVTPGAYQPTFSGMTVCAFAEPAPRLCFSATNAFLTKFDAKGATLVFSTYLGTGAATAGPIAIAPDGSMFLGGGVGAVPGAGINMLYHVNAAGSSLLASATAAGGVLSMAVGPDGNLYVAGQDAQAAVFQGTPGAFQTAPVPVPVLSGQGGGPYAFITKFDPNFKVLASTLLGGDYGDQANSLAIDASGNVLVAGFTQGLGFPTRTPLVNAFSLNTGFVSKLTPDLSTLLFSTYLGDAQIFTVNGVAASPDGDFVIAGTTGNASTQTPTQVWVNKINAGTLQSFRIDTVLNAASLLDAPLSPGETVVVRGAGFASNAQLLINGAPVPAIAADSQSITAVVPQTIPLPAAELQVQSAGVLSNPIVAPVNPAAPGLFSADGSGVGQGYILNADGTRNSPANPAKIGDRITVFATGVGPLTFTGPYAVAQYLPTVFIDGFFAGGVAATFGPVPGLPGQVYQLTVLIPNPAATFPDLKNFAFPPLVPVVLQSNLVSSQLGLAISISQ